MQPFTISDFVCPECGHIIPIPRKNSQRRENGHIKDLYCPWCDKIQKMTEYRADQPIRNGLGEIIV